eukprot:2787499-Amphidinium_carterae.1
MNAAQGFPSCSQPEQKNYHLFGQNPKTLSLYDVCIAFEPRPCVPCLKAHCKVVAFAKPCSPGVERAAQCKRVGPAARDWAIDSRHNVKGAQVDAGFGMSGGAASVHQSTTQRRFSGLSFGRHFKKGGACSIFWWESSHSEFPIRTSTLGDCRWNKWNEGMH